MAETFLKGQQAFSEDGWQRANETWTYASSSTITVPSGAASKYQKGDRLKFTQTTVKYAVVVSVADTVLTIAVNTDYTVANAAITANYYSHQANPMGYPGWFTYTPAATTGSGFSGGTYTGKYQLTGRVAHIAMSVAGITQTGTTGTITFSTPFTNGSGMSVFGVGRVYRGGTGAIATWYMESASANIYPFVAVQNAGQTWTNNNDYYLDFEIFVPI